MEHGTCKHFNGVQHATCKAGVAYRDFQRGIPCVKYIAVSVRGGTMLRAGEEPAQREPWEYDGIACERYTEPTDEEVQASDEAYEVRMKKTFAARRVAGKWRVKPKPQEDRAEVVECPVCAGRLHLRQSAYNGHVHGQCETASCVSWME